MNFRDAYLQQLRAIHLVLTPVADCEVDPWVCSRRGKPGSSDVFIGRRGGITPPIFLKLQESWSKVGHAAEEMTTVYSVICD